MKNLKLVAVLAGMLVAGIASAQTKIAYIRIDDIVSVMPELAPGKVNMDTVGQKFVSDSIMPRINYVNSEYQRKLQEYTDSTKPKAVRDQILRDLQAYREELDGAESYVQQALQFKQQEYLKPYYTKARKAIEAVAKKKGYTHVFSTDVFLVAPTADDISYAVLEELKIKLPNQPAAGTKPPANTPAKTGN
jgi:outer membrane protein